jgi:hypothetical protein
MTSQFLVLVTQFGAAIFFGLWQRSVCAGLFIFFVLELGIEIARRNLEK